MSDLEPTAMVAAQLRHLADIRELWTHYASAARLEEKLRGAMGWKTVGGNQYLTRYWDDPVSRKKHMSSRGRRSPETEAKKADFERGRAEADAMTRRVKAGLKPLTRVRPALRLRRRGPG